MTIGMTRSLADDNLTDALDRQVTTDIFDVGIACGTVSVGTSAVVAKVGTNNLTNRKGISIHNSSSVTIYWGCSNVTTSIGTPIVKDQQIFLTAGANLNIYLIAGSSSNTVRIVELA